MVESYLWISLLFYHFFYRFLRNFKICSRNVLPATTFLVHCIIRHFTPFCSLSQGCCHCCRSYIVGGEFLKDKLEADIAELKKKANDAYNEAEKAYLKSISDKAIKQLDEQNIRYEYMTEPKRLVIYVTAEEFKSLSLDNVSRYGLDISVTKGVTVNAIA